MLGLLAWAVFAPPRVPIAIADFRAAIAKRRRDEVDDDGRRDPAISRCLDILIASVAAELRACPVPTDKQVESCVSQFLHSVAPRNEDFSPVDEYKSVGARWEAGSEANFIVGRMGSVTRTVAYDVKWRPLRLPPEFAWNTPWYPDPKRLKSGMWLMDSEEVLAMGSRVGLRFVWLRREGRRMVKVGEFEAGTTLDYEQAEIDGDLVTAHTVDEPKTFSEAASEPLFGRLTTWDCSSATPRVVRVTLLQPTLRAIERDSLAAFHARRPTPLQRRLRRYWPANDRYANELNTWSAHELQAGVTRVVWNEELAIDLKRSGRTYRVVAILPWRKPGSRGGTRGQRP